VPLCSYDGSKLELNIEKIFKNGKLLKEKRKREFKSMRDNFQAFSLRFVKVQDVKLGLVHPVTTSIASAGSRYSFHKDSFSLFGAIGRCRNHYFV